jgi:hypothetical protein
MIGIALTDLLLDPLAEIPGVIALDLVEDHIDSARVGWSCLH